jgi:tetratricopeptide (TPR) repeat protein
LKIASILIFAICNSYIGICNINNPDSSTYYSQLAVQHEAAKKITEADKSYRKALSFSPSDIPLQLQYADFLMKQKKFYVALPLFEKVLFVDGTNAAALLKTIEINFMLRKWTGVIDYGKKYIAGTKGTKVNFMIGKLIMKMKISGRA